MNYKDESSQMMNQIVTNEKKDAPAGRVVKTIKIAKAASAVPLQSLARLAQRGTQRRRACPAPTGCGADCEAAVRFYLPAGTTGVYINAGGQTVGQGTVARNEYGMVALVGANGSDPTFVSTCKAEIINK